MKRYFTKIDILIAEKLKKIDDKNFHTLWSDKESYERHVSKRIRYGHVTNAVDYLQKIKEAFFHADEIYLKKFDDEFKRGYNRFDRIYYKKGEWWVDIFWEDGTIATAFKLEKEWEEVLYKGDRNTFKIYKVKRGDDGYEIERVD